MGCKHFAISDMPTQINSMCLFTQTAFTGILCQNTPNIVKNVLYFIIGARYLQGMLRDMQEVNVEVTIQGAGISYRDATPRMVLEGKVEN